MNITHYFLIFTMMLMLNGLSLWAQETNTKLCLTATRIDGDPSTSEMAPIINESTFLDLNSAGDSEADNINGPSIIKIPDWVPDEYKTHPSAAYYLYFAHHGGKFIRMAWSANIAGPWQMFNYGTAPGTAWGASGNFSGKETPHDGVLDLNFETDANGNQTFRIQATDNYYARAHIASPDIEIDEVNQRIIMYYHAPTSGVGDSGQQTFVAVSKYGLNFNKAQNQQETNWGQGTRPVIPGQFYFKTFKIKGEAISPVSGSPVQVNQWFAYSNKGYLYKAKTFTTDGSIASLENADQDGGLFTPVASHPEGTNWWDLIATTDNPLDGTMVPQILRDFSSNVDGVDRDIGEGLNAPRHFDIFHDETIDRDKIFVLYTGKGDNPESVMLMTFSLEGLSESDRLKPALWQKEHAVEHIILSPEMDWEGGDLQGEYVSENGSAVGVKGLRDPDVFKDDDGQIYLFYAGRGEEGIGIASIDITPVNINEDIIVATMEDAYIRGGNYANDNYGAEETMLIKTSSASYQREGFLKFDLSNINLTPTAVKLKLHLSKTRENVTHQLFMVNDDSWSESTITYNNRPTSEIPITSELLPTTINYWMEFDITNEVLNELQGDKVITLKLVDEVSGNVSAYYTSEHPDVNLRPHLIYEMHDNPTPSTCDMSTAVIVGTACVNINQACNDNDACTTGETYDANCNCSGGVFEDTDNDNVCDAADVCAGFDDGLIGTACDDGDACTTGDVYLADCTCAGTFLDADNDGVCAANDIDDNDACQPNPCTTCTTIDSNDFENSWGIWNDGGGDCARPNLADYANSGTRSIRIRDNSGSSSSSYTDNLDLNAYNSVEISFSYMANSMENNEDFFLEVSTDGGSNYTLAEDWVRGTDFSNNIRYNELVTINGLFSSNTKFRFRCDASGNADKVYIDDVVIVVCSDAAARPIVNKVNTVNEIQNISVYNDIEIFENEHIQIEEDHIISTVDKIKSKTTAGSMDGLKVNTNELQVSVFPNPTQNQFTLVLNELAIDGDIAIVNSVGQTIYKSALSQNNTVYKIDANHLKAGVYMLYIVDKSSTNIKATQKIIKY